MLSLPQISLLLAAGVSAVFGASQQRVVPEGVGESFLSPPAAFGGGGGTLFGRQADYVCTDPDFRTQCVAIPGQCCGTDTYCCPNNMPFCCGRGGVCQIQNGTESCCPSNYELCDGRQCALPGSVCCNDYNHVCNEGADCCKGGCCNNGMKCCGEYCCDPGNVCCPGADGGMGGCCWPGQICCGDECCDPETEVCSTSGTCVAKAPPTTQLSRTTSFVRTTVTATPVVQTGAAERWGTGGIVPVLAGMVAVGVAVGF